MNNASTYPLFESPQDYVFNMTALTSAQAKRLWRASIKEAWNNRCAYCGNPPIDDQSLTIDHVKPRSKGGEDKTNNTIPACRSCNADKGSMEWLAWFQMQDFYTLEAEVRIRNWLKTGEVKFGDEDDAVWLDEMINHLVA